MIQRFACVQEPEISFRVEANPIAHHRQLTNIPVAVQVGIICQTGCGNDQTRLPVFGIAVVGQHVDIDWRVLVGEDAGIVHRDGLVVDPLHGYRHGGLRRCELAIEYPVDEGVGHFVLHAADLAQPAERRSNGRIV